MTCQREGLEVRIKEIEHGLPTERREPFLMRYDCFLANEMEILEV